MAVPASEEAVDARIGRVAAAQHGVFSRTQAFAEGATRAAIETRLAAGRWETRYPGVYVVAGAPPSWRQSLLAACLVGGEGSIASHRSAAQLWQLAVGDEGVLELSAPKSRRVRRPGIIVHQVAGIEPIDVAVIDAIPVTTPTRTIIDLAALVPRDGLEETLDDALRRRLTTVPRLQHRIAGLGRRGRTGAGILSDLVEARTAVGGRADSALETRLMRLIRRARLPPPEGQYEIRDRGRLIARVDLAYPDARFAIEADGYAWHSGRQRWARDLRRRNELTARGWRVIHVTWNDIEHRPAQIVDMIARALATVSR